MVKTCHKRIRNIKQSSSTAANQQKEVNNPHWRVRPQVLSSNQTSPHVREMLWSRGQPVAIFVNKSDVNSMTEVMNVNSNARIVG